VLSVANEFRLQLHLAGHLAWYDSQKRSRVQVSLEKEIALIELLQQLGVPIAEVAIVVVNGVAVELERVHVSNDDRVDLYPPVDGGSEFKVSSFRFNLKP